MYGGDASLNSRLFVRGDASLNSNLYVGAKTYLGSDVSLNGNLSVYGGDVSLNSRLFVRGDASLNSNLYVGSKTYLGGDVSLNGNFSMYGGDASLNGRLFVRGDASLNSNLYVGAKTYLGNDVSLNGNLLVYGGDASLNSRLFVRGDASLNSNLYVGAKTYLGNDVSLNGNLLVYGGDASLNGRLFVRSDASLNSNLYVGAKTYLGNDVSLNGNLLVYGGDASLNGRLFVIGDASLNSNLYVGSKTYLGNDVSLNGNLSVYGGDASLNSRLFVRGDASLNSNLYVGSKTYLGNDVSLNGNLLVYGGDASLNGRLFVRGDVSLNSNLYVGSKTYLGNDVSLNGNLLVYGGDASLNGRLFVRGDVSLNSNLYVGSKTYLGNDVSLNGNLLVYGGDASLNGRLFVRGDASLNGNVYVATGKKVGIGKIPDAAYSLDVLGNINITNGSLYVNNSLFSGGGGASLSGNVQVGSNNGFVTVDKTPFYYDPNMTIFYDFDNESVLGNTSLKNLATGQYDGFLSPALTTMSSGQRFGTACLGTNISVSDQNVLINPFQIGDSFSISVWIKAGLPTFTETIFDFADSTNTGNYGNTIALGINSTGQLLPILSNIASPTVNLLSTISTVVATNTWNHIVWNIASNVSTIYLNGYILNRQQFLGTIKPEARAFNYIANTNNTTGSQDYVGYIDNFRFYSGKTLSYAEVYQLYTSQTYNLDVSGGILVNGSSVIFEPSGTVASATKGTLTILHGDASGGSSIVFPSVNSFGGDYAYIQYQENVPYTGQITTESGLLSIGIESDITSPHIDRICLMAANSTGRVGINTKFPAYTLDVNGTVNATSYNATSDYRVKTDVMALDASFNVDVLKPVIYTNTRHGRQDIGFIAHEVQEHYPFLVNGEKDAEQFQSLNYIGLIGILTKEIQDLKRRLAETEAMTTSIVNHNQMVNKKMDAKLEQVYSILSTAETKVSSVEATNASIDNNMLSVESKVLYVDTRVAAFENMVQAVDNKIRMVENAVQSVENKVLLEQARVTVCETNIDLNKSAINNLEERFQS
jgi:predicted acyltransferase (DUF342 family)